MKIVVNNRQVHYDYHVVHTTEAGLVLKGTEIKSLREGKARINEAFVMITKGEAFIHNMFIPHYAHGNINNHEESRTRKLLLNKSEINAIELECKKNNYTVIPVVVYLKEGRAKVEIAVAKGKKLFDKRETEKNKSIEKSLRREDY